MFLLILTTDQVQNYTADFNTSHVSINPQWQTGESVEANFNTSHVSINRYGGESGVVRQLISIHLMFLLIGHVRVQEVHSHYFNTSHVSINLNEKPILNRLFIFQYISCFY